ncbi:MAG: efflux RND transporter periplasmic adaptor subunit [Planctomycetia bacterium]|nr:efflux RND transporter periplasmic adaptor subunit [Planctomycetia bacterium]
MSTIPQRTISGTQRTVAGSAAAPQADPAFRTRLLRRLRESLTTLAVVSVLGALAFWGYKSDWTLPKLSTLLGQGTDEVEQWCKEHNVPEAIDIECNRSLAQAAPDYGWCKEHGIAECPLDHPEVAQLKTTPRVTQEDFDRARRALALRPRKENNSRCKSPDRRIQFASIEALDKVGVDIAIVQRRLIVEAVVANGEVVYDETRAAHLASRVPGTVWRVEKQVGDHVRKGELLALVDAAEIGRAKAELLQAIAQRRLKQTNVERLRPLVADGSIPERDFRESDAALQEATIRLVQAQQQLVNLGLSVRASDFDGLPTEQIAERIQFLGLPSDLAAELAGDSTTSNLFPIRSPLDGVVVVRKVVAGEVVDTSTMLFSVADVRRMWLTLDVRQDDARFLSLGQKVLFLPSDSHDEPEVNGTLAWISTEADDQTRTVKVRVDLPNDDGRLRANTFGTGRIVLREEPAAIVVPSEAVHWDGDCNVVFVRDKNFLDKDSPKFFHVRQVRVGVKDGDTTEIIAGLLPGEVIASKNSVVLQAQLLKSNLGAGCGCADGH